MGPFQLEIFLDCKSTTDGVAGNVELWDEDKVTIVTWSIGRQLEDQLQLADSVALCCAQEKVVSLLFLLSSTGNFDDFSLEDALGEIKTTKKPLPSQKTPPQDFDDFNLDDALHPDGPKPNPPAKPRDTDNPKRDQPKDTGTFDDADLLDGNSPKGGGDGSGSNERRGQTPNNGQEDEGSQGAIAGIVSAVAATVIGAVSSFIAYQKKKLCFKQSDEENVNMDSHRGAQSEPPVQRTLLEN
ncbi:CD99 antigen [Manacus vitellinus]|uniref:CD99 antigen n=1 Tax=Manacus vitellinus TaxID=328815 RepID=UPI000846353D|nr:CD99 antigen [Manacus vitellinus]